LLCDGVEFIFDHYVHVVMVKTGDYVSSHE
jgi:hypothetical protein